MEDIKEKVEEKLETPIESVTDTPDAKSEKKAKKETKKKAKKEKRSKKKSDDVEKKTNILKHKRRRLGDRKDGYKLRTVNPMIRLMPYIMPQRCDALNTYADSFEISKADAYCRSKVKAGMKNFTMLHVFIAAYVRMVSQRPAVNRFVSGQKVYTRNELSVLMTIKKRMARDAEDTCIKVKFEPTDTIDEIYAKFNAAVVDNQGKEEDKSSFDKLNKVLSLIPGLLLRWTVNLLNFLDYFGWLPKWLTDLSPFHGSMIITSMGSLGIKPIYHHIYNFGNLPVFLAYGSKRTEYGVDADGNVTKNRYIDIKAVTDERICDGFYYASAFKLLRKYVENPELLEAAPEQIFFCKRANSNLRWSSSISFWSSRRFFSFSRSSSLESDERRSKCCCLAAI